VLRRPPLGNDDASGSCFASTLPENDYITAPLPSGSENESCFSAVPPVNG